MIFASYLKRLGLRVHDASSAFAGLYELEPVNLPDEPFQSRPFNAKPYGSYINTAERKPWTPRWWTERTGEAMEPRESVSKNISEHLAQL